ncbi:MAG: 30S ribosomal protein S1 [Cyanobacteria bacterium HKST-UBA06]|nr:30S ribosomal protein S1 [Cyanobacteria bacterium HKST-UBA06]
MSVSVEPEMNVSTPVKVFHDGPLSEQQEAFADLLNNNLNTTFLPNHVVVGEIVSVEKDHLIVDIGAKCEGVVPLKEVGRVTEQELALMYKPGQVKEFYILRDFDENEPYVLSLRRVESWKAWEQLKMLQDKQEILEVVVNSVTRGGVLVNVMSLKGFIPASQLRIAKTLEDLIGEQIPAKLLEVDRTKNKLILSHREAVFEYQAEQRATTISNLHEGMEVKGQVVKITHFGAFVDIDGIDGLLPLSEISWRRLRHPSDELSLGQEVTVEVLTIDHAQERISLSMKRLSDDPWKTVNERFNQGDQVKGTISKFLNSGFLAELEPGVEAFCSYNQVARDDLTLGETRTFSIVSIAGRDRRITLETV